MAKHPVPKQKTSKARTSRRFKAFQNRSRRKLSEAIQLTKCDNCGSDVRIHHACTGCGFYRGQNIFADNNKVEKAAEPEEVKTIKAD